MKSINTIPFTVLIILSIAASKKLWAQEKTFGGALYDAGHMLTVTDDGGLILTGQTKSFGDTLGDTYVIKLDSLGNTEWTKITGGNKLEGGNSIASLSDGGYFVTCHTESYGAGDCDGWMYKTDNRGNTLWTNTYGGLYDDVGRQGIQTADGNLVVTGLSEVSDTAGDGYLAKYNNSSGTQLWCFTYGSPGYEQAQRIIETPDKGFVVAGATTVNCNGPEDIWVFKTDSLGNLLWSKNVGGPNFEEAYGLCAATDGGYIISGLTSSYTYGGEDAFLFKLDDSGNLVWSKNYGGTRQDRAMSVVPAPDGGYMIAGFTLSFEDSSGDVMLIKTDRFGNQEWMKTFGGVGNDEANWIVNYRNGKYAVLGTTYSQGNGDADIYLLTVDGSGNFVTGIANPLPDVPEIQLFPNPANASVSLAGHESVLGSYSIDFINNVGERILSFSGSPLHINVSSLPSGLYFVNIHQNDKTFIRKLVKL